MTKTEAMAFTRKQWREIIPQGRNTPGHHFFNLIYGPNAVGGSWLFKDIKSNSAFLFDIFLNPTWRGKGLGKKSLEALEEFASSKGARTLELNVFASNTELGGFTTHSDLHPWGLIWSNLLMSAQHGRIRRLEHAGCGPQVV